ncbi:MAG: hypothetical protein ACO1RX_20600 [Candidatus Sericytochromatia bacterium]
MKLRISCLVVISSVLLGLPSAPVPFQNAAEAAAQRVSHANWGMSFAPPSGWAMQAQDQGYIFAQAAQQRVILMVPHPYTSLAALKQAMAAGQVMQDDNAHFTLKGGWKDLSKTASLSQISGTLQGESVAGATAVVISSAGTPGVMLFSLGQPGSWNAQSEQTLKALATSVQFKKAAAPAQQPLQALLKGKTLSYTKSEFSGGANGSSSSNQQATLHLCSDGTFRSVYLSTASVSGGGMSSYSGGTPQTTTGTWKLGQHQGQQTLILTPAQGQALTSRIALQQGQVVIDGKRWTLSAGQLCR